MKYSPTQQATRLYRMAILAVGVAAHFTMCGLLVWLGLLAMDPLAFVALATLAMAGFVVMALVVLMEWNLTCRDPDLALPQMLWAATVVILTTRFSTEMESLVLLFGLAMIVVGVNRLDKRGLVAFPGYTLAAYSLLALYPLQRSVSASLPEIVLIIAMAMLLVCGTLLYRREMAIIENSLTARNRELRDALERMRELATRDDETGVANSRHLLEVLAKERAMTERYGHCFSICFVTVDQSHRQDAGFAGAGSQVLMRAARALQSMVREVDCVARLDGDQFVLVLSGASERDAVAAAERIRQRLAGLEAGPGRFGVSIGVTGYRPGEKIRAAMERAGRAVQRIGSDRPAVADIEPKTRTA